MELLNIIILNKNIPENWANIIEIRSNPRTGNIYKIPLARKNMSENNIFTKATKTYNSLPQHLRKNENLIVNLKQLEEYLLNTYIDSL